MVSVKKPQTASEVVAGLVKKTPAVKKTRTAGVSGAKARSTTTTAKTSASSTLTAKARLAATEAAKKKAKTASDYGFPADFPNRAKVTGFCRKIEKYGFGCHFDGLRNVGIQLPLEERWANLYDNTVNPGYKAIEAAYGEMIQKFPGGPRHDDIAAMTFLLERLNTACLDHLAKTKPFAKPRATKANPDGTIPANFEAVLTVPVLIDQLRSYGVNYDEKAEPGVARLHPLFYGEFAAVEKAHGYVYTERQLEQKLEAHNTAIRENLAAGKKFEERKFLVSVMADISAWVLNLKDTKPTLQELAEGLRKYGVEAELTRIIIGEEREPEGNADPMAMLKVTLLNPFTIGSVATVGTSYGQLQHIVKSIMTSPSASIDGSGSVRKILNLLTHNLSQVARIPEDEWRKQLEEVQQEMVRTDKLRRFADAGFKFATAGDPSSAYLPAPGDFEHIEGVVKNFWIDAHLAHLSAKNMAYVPGEPLDVEDYARWLGFDVERIVAYDRIEKMSSDQKVEHFENIQVQARAIIRSYGIEINVQYNDDDYSMPSESMFLMKLIDEKYSYLDIESAYSKSLSYIRTNPRVSHRDALLHYLEKVKTIAQKEEEAASIQKERVSRDIDSVVDAIVPEVKELTGAEGTVQSDAADKGDDLNQKLRAYGFKIDLAGNTALVRMRSRGHFDAAYTERTGLTLLDVSRCYNAVATAASSGAIAPDAFRSELAKRLDGHSSAIKGQAAAQKDLLGENITNAKLAEVGFILTRNAFGDEHIDITTEAGGRARGALAAMRSVIGATASDPVDLQFKRALARVAAAPNLQDEARIAWDESIVAKNLGATLERVMGDVANAEDAVKQTDEDELKDLIDNTGKRVQEEAKSVLKDASEWLQSVKGSDGVPSSEMAHLAITEILEFVKRMDARQEAAEKQKVLDAMSAGLMFAKVTETLKKSQPRTLVQVDLDKLDKDPSATLEQLIAQARSTTELPVAVTAEQLKALGAEPISAGHIALGLGVKFNYEAGRNAIPANQLGEVYESLPAASDEKQHFSNAYILRYFLANLPEVHLLDPNNLPEDIQKVVEQIREQLIGDLGSSIGCDQVGRLRDGERPQFRSVAFPGDDTLTIEDVNLTGGRSVLGARLKK